MFARQSLSRSGGRTVTGIEQVIQSATDYWVARVKIKVMTQAQILYYRSVQAQNWGRAGEWIIPVCQPGIPTTPAVVDYSWSDDWAVDFSIGPPPTTLPPGYGALVTTLAAIGARSLTFEFPSGVDFVPLAGMFFSIGNRLYSIGTVTNVGVRRYTVTFSPGLRAAAAVEAIVEFASARCLMRLAEDNAGQLDLDWNKFSEQQLNFVEVF